MSFTLTPKAVRKLRKLQKTILAGLKAPTGAPVVGVDMIRWLTFTPVRGQKAVGFKSRVVQSKIVSWCNTAGCVAGHLVLQAGWKPNLQVVSGMARNPHYGLRNPIHVAEVRKGRRTVDVEAQAARELGLSVEDTQDLFNPWARRSPHYLYANAESAGSCGPIVTPYAVLAAIDSFIEAHTKTPEAQA